MIEKHRRRKQPRRHPHFVWADPERFYIERMSAGLTQVQAAQYLGVSIRTMRNWETGCNRIPVPAFKLIRMRARAIVHVPGWDGWRFGRDGALLTPDGRSFQPWELHNLQLVVSLARRYMESRKLAPLPVVAENVSMLRVVA
ncbi:MAG: VC1465 family Xer recombination activation factor [Thiobacillus sp.]|nr:VC1465 family Xer recombination activation factor [Thiobacillus sp.]